MQAPPQPGRFHSARPRDLHQALPPWHRLAFIMTELPKRLEALAGELGVEDGQRVLDYGCADTPYRHFFPAHVEYLAADIVGNPVANVEIAADGSLPLADESVDVVLSTQVLEHVDDPALYLSEAYRVLRPGGRLLLSTHGVMFYHPDPVDYWRWTSAGLRRVVEAPGFSVQHLDGLMSLGASGVQLIQEAFYYRLPAGLRAIFALIMQTIARVIDRVEKDGMHELNAMVYVVVAERP